jgi:hypothetical protein
MQYMRSELYSITHWLSAQSNIETTISAEKWNQTLWQRRSKHLGFCFLVRKSKLMPVTITAALPFSYDYFKRCLCFVFVGLRNMLLELGFCYWTNISLLLDNMTRLVFQNHQFSPVLDIGSFKQYFSKSNAHNFH